MDYHIIYCSSKIINKRKELVKKGKTESFLLESSPITRKPKMLHQMPSLRKQAAKIKVSRINTEYSDGNRTFCNDEKLTQIKHLKYNCRRENQNSNKMIIFAEKNPLCFALF